MCILQQERMFLSMWANVPWKKEQAKSSIICLLFGSTVSATGVSIRFLHSWKRWLPPLPHIILFLQSSNLCEAQFHETPFPSSCSPPSNSPPASPSLSLWWCGEKWHTFVHVNQLLLLLLALLLLALRFLLRQLGSLDLLLHLPLLVVLLHCFLMRHTHTYTHTDKIRIWLLPPPLFLVSSLLYNVQKQQHAISKFLFREGFDS